MSPPDTSALNGRGYDGDDAEGRPIPSRPTLRLLAALSTMRPGLRCLVRLDLFGLDGERLPLPPRRMLIHWPGEGSSEVEWPDTGGRRVAYAKIDLVAGPEPARPT
jgi:hypothetical protein